MRASFAKNHLFTSVALVCLMGASSAVAQTVPKSVDPSKVEKQFEPRFQDTTGNSEAVVPETPQPAAPSASSSKTFELRAISIEGSSVYEESELTPLFSDRLNTRISIGEAQQLAQQVTLKYRNDGYILTQARVNPQRIRDGVLSIEVIEGYINDVIIEGEAQKHDISLVKAYANKITMQRPLHISTLERYLLLMDDLPGATAKGVVRPSPDTFGAADLVVNMQHKTWAGSVSADNRGTKYIGPMQYSATLAANSLLGMSERTLVRAAATIPADELKFFEIQHEQQVGTEGTRMIGSASYSETEPGSTLTPLDIEGDSVSLSLRAVHPWLRSRTENFSTRAIFDYRNTHTDILSTDFSDDRIRALRIGGAYDFTDMLRGVDLIDIEISQGLNIFNASESGTQRSRANGESDFSKIELNFARTQPVFMPQLSIYTAFAGQLSADPLLTSEQFSIGGASFGSAYDPAELSGDHGAAARAELRFGERIEDPLLASLQVYGFYDIGAVWTKGTSGHNSLASAGVGSRLNFTPWLSGSVELAQPLTKEVAAKSDEDPRLFFSLTGRF